MNRVTNLALSLLAIFVAIVGAEVGIRVWNRYDPLFRPEPLRDSFQWATPHARAFSPYRPGSMGMTHGHTVKINSLGFRGPEVSTAKRPGQFRILVLGDSFTFGQGIAEEDR